MTRPSPDEGNCGVTRTFPLSAGYIGKLREKVPGKRAHYRLVFRSKLTSNNLQKNRQGKIIRPTFKKRARISDSKAFRI